MLNARLDAVQTADNAVGLWTYVKSIWGTATGYTTVPDYGLSGSSVTKIKFDTKFGDVIKGYYNFFIVENMPQEIKPQIIGGGRDTITDVKRVQIMCLGPSCKNNKWLMEKHIDSLINGNKTGMQTTYGIDWMVLSQWQEIPVSTEADTTQLKGMKIDQARSSALVTLKSDNYAVAL